MSPQAERCLLQNDAASLNRKRGISDVTDDERQKADALISRLETAVGAVFPREGANAGLIAEMIQNLNGLRSLLGLVRAH